MVIKFVMGLKAVVIALISCFALHVWKVLMQKDNTLQGSSSPFHAQKVSMFKNHFANLQIRFCVSIVDLSMENQFSHFLWTEIVSALQKRQRKRGLRSKLFILFVLLFA